MLKRSKIRVHPPIADHNENPYIWLPQEYNMKNTDKISYELRYNKSHVHDRKRMYKLSSEIRDLGVKPDPVVNVPVVDMSNQIGTTVCVDMINSTAKRFQHKKGRPKRIFSPVSTKATVDTNIGVPTNEDAKVEKIINMTEQQLAAMEFKDYFGTRIGRKGQSLQFIYNFDNWVFARVANVKVDQATGKTTYYYNPSEFSALNMVPSIKNIWKQKTIYIPVRFGIDVMPIEQSEALIPANDVDPVSDMRGQENYNNVQDFMRQNPNVVIDIPDVQAPHNSAVRTEVIDNTDDLTVQKFQDFIKSIYKTSYGTNATNFRNKCQELGWDYNRIINHYNITDAVQKDIIRKITELQNIGTDETFWTYATNFRGKKEDKIYIYNPTAPKPEQPAQPVATPVEQPAVEQPTALPTVEQPTPSTVQQIVAAPVQQQSVIENAMNEQVQQRSGRHAPVTQQSTSVFTDQQPEQQPIEPKIHPSVQPQLPYKQNTRGELECPFFTWFKRGRDDPAAFDNFMYSISDSVFKIIKNVYASHNMKVEKNVWSTLNKLFIDSHLTPVILGEIITKLKESKETTAADTENFKYFLKKYNEYANEIRSNVIPQ